MQEELLEQNLENIILDFYKNTLVSGNIKGKDNIRLAYRAHVKDNAKGAIVILNGRTDSCIKYAEFLYDLKDIPYSIYVLDHRGQGLSERLLEDPLKGHVEKFEDYSFDLHTFIENIVWKKGYKDVVLLGYSMGGAIALDYAIRNPGKIKELILCSPMLKINLGVSEFWAHTFLNIARLLNKKNDYIPRNKNYDYDKVFFNMSTSQKRFNMMKKIRELYPATIIKAPTNHWLKEALKICKKVVRKAKKIKIPVLLLQAGNDNVVENHLQDVLFKRLKHVNKVILPESKHDILMERDSIRNIAIKTIKDFLETT